MQETQNQKVWKHLLKYGSITAYEMWKLYNICHPPSRIRDLRKKYGYDTIQAEPIVKKETVYDNEGKKRVIVKRFNRYYIPEYLRAA